MKGGMPRPKPSSGPPHSLMTATRRREGARWTTAFTKWVVPTITQPIEHSETLDADITVRTALVMPVVTSGVVGALWEAITEMGSRDTRTASVLVPSRLSRFN